MSCQLMLSVENGKLSVWVTDVGFQQEPSRMSYYRYITSVYKSYLPELNRTLRSSSVPRTVTAMDYCEFLLGVEYLQTSKWKLFLSMR